MVLSCCGRKSVSSYLSCDRWLNS